MSRLHKTNRTRSRNKYHFTQYLERPGDFVETTPITKREAWNITYAAHMWAWDNRCRVNVESFYAPDDKKIVRVTLTDKDRERFYK